MFYGIHGWVYGKKEWTDDSPAIVKPMMGNIRNE
jgi:hypothetical protein